MSVLSRITLRAAREIELLRPMGPVLRQVELRRIVRAAIEEAVVTLPTAELDWLLADRAALERHRDQGRAA